MSFHSEMCLGGNREIRGRGQRTGKRFLVKGQQARRSGGVLSPWVP